MAHGLRHKLKLEPGLVLCVFSPNSIEYHRILFAAECARSVPCATMH
jgi:acyl-CoA synthetase (AMP-forming)/AMP-acid ligase II